MKKPSVDASVLSSSQDTIIGLDKDTLDPEMHYRMILDNPQRTSKAYARGYRPVSRRDDGVKLLYDTRQGDAEDLIRVGDTILMQCPKHVYERRKEANRDLAIKRLGQPEGQFRRKARNANVRIAE